MRSRSVVVCLFAVIALASAAFSAPDEAAFPVTGKVIKPDGAPAAGALVEARSYSRKVDWRVSATATTGADGKFTIQLKQGEYRTYAALDALVYLDQSEMTEVRKDGSLSKPIDMRLEKGCKVDGTVMDSSTGKPAGGVRILTRDGDHAESNDSGEWHMVLPLRNHAFTAVKEGYSWPIVNFTASGETAKVKIEIKPGGTIKGRVLDEQGKPIAGASVGSGMSYFAFSRVKTDADGRFTLAGLDPDAKIALSASADGYEYEGEQSVSFPAGQRETQLDLTLKKQQVRMITGRVTRPDGTSVEGARVAYGWGSNWDGYTDTKTDKDGKYKLDKAEYSKCLVVATAPGLAPVSKPVEEDKDAQIDFVMKPGHSIEGRVEDEAGNPIAGAYVTAGMTVEDAQPIQNLYAGIDDTQTDKDGKFKLENLPEGFVFADVYAENYDRIENERLKVDRRDLTLVLRKEIPGQICGMVLRQSDGKPITEFNVRIDFSMAGGRSSGISPGLCEQGVNFQSPDGKFTIKGLKPKEGYRVEVTAPGYLVDSVDPVMVKPVADGSYKDAIVRLKPAREFEGTITDAATGGPVEGVSVTAWDTSSCGSATSFRWEMAGSSLKSVSAHTGADGKFKFESMPFPSVMIMLEKPGFARTMLRKVKLSEPLQTSLVKGATITGSMAVDQGRVPAGAYLHVDHKDLNLSFSAQSKPDGSFTCSDLPPGEYFVAVYKSSGPMKYQIVEVVPGATCNVDWTKQGPVAVEGKVLQNGKPMAKVGIRVNSDRTGMNWEGGIDTSPDGTYKLTLSKPGKYLFNCEIGEWTDPNRISVAKTLALGDGVNKVDFNLPCGSISGKLVDKRTGNPLSGRSVRLYVHETEEQRRGKSSLYSYSAEPEWMPQNECKTGKSGAFEVKNLRAGKWMVCSVAGTRSRAIPAAIVKLADGEAKCGVVAKVPPTGSASITVDGKKQCPRAVIVTCVAESGMAYYPEYGNAAYMTDFGDLPAGKMRAFVMSLDSTDYLPMEVPFEVRPGETTNLSIKLKKGPRIVFRPKGNDAPESVSVAFRITTLDGKPVLRRAGGLVWGSILSGKGLAEPASLAIKPGTYLVKAAAHDNWDSWRNESDLTGWSGKVGVVAGKDTIIEIPWVHK